MNSRRTTQTLDLSSLEQINKHNLFDDCLRLKSQTISGTTMTSVSPDDNLARFRKENTPSSYASTTAENAFINNACIYKNEFSYDNSMFNDYQVDNEFFVSPEFNIPSINETGINYQEATKFTQKDEIAKGSSIKSTSSNPYLNNKEEYNKEEYNKLVTSKSRKQINRIFQLLKSCNGDIKEVLSRTNDFSEEELMLIYNVRFNRQENKVFTPEEDEELFRQISIFGLDFKNISKIFKNKSPCDLKRRYIKISILNNILPFNKLCEEMSSTDISERINQMNKSNLEQATNPNMVSFAYDFYNKMGKEGKKIINFSPSIEESFSTSAKAELNLIDNPAETALGLLNKILYNKQIELSNENEDMNTEKKQNYQSSINLNEQDFSENSFNEEEKNYINNISSRHESDESSQIESNPVFLNHKRSYNFSDIDEKFFVNSDIESVKSHNYMTDHEHIKLMKTTNYPIESVTATVNNTKTNKPNTAKLNLEVRKYFEDVNSSTNKAISQVSSLISTYQEKFADITSNAIINKEILNKTQITQEKIKESLTRIFDIFNEEENRVSFNLTTKLLTDFSSQTTKSSLRDSIQKKCDLVVNLINILKIQIFWVQKIESVY